TTAVQICTKRRASAIGTRRMGAPLVQVTTWMGRSIVLRVVIRSLHVRQYRIRSSYRPPPAEPSRPYFYFTASPRCLLQPNPPVSDQIADVLALPPRANCGLIPRSHTTFRTA